MPSFNSMDTAAAGKICSMPPSHFSDTVSEILVYFMRGCLVSRVVITEVVFY